MGDEEVLKSKYARGYRKQQLLRACAEEKGTWREIAERFGISETGLYKWRERNAAAIAEIKANLDDAMSGLWIAKKVNRVAEYQSDVELIGELVGDGAGVENVQVLLKVKHGALRSAAEELGQLKPIEADGPARVDVRILGVNGDAL